MANIMQEKEIKNKSIHREAFDLSRHRAFTAKVGELLPCMVEEVVPGDNFKINIKHFLRTQPLETAAFTRIKEYYDFYFVPYRLLWRYFPQFITEMTKNQQNANGIDSSVNLNQDHPYIVSKKITTYLNTMMGRYSDIRAENSAGFNRGITSCKLLEYLGYSGYGKIVRDGSKYVTKGLLAGDGKTELNVKLNPFPLLAYQKVYSDYFRRTQWEDANPSSFNVDYLPENSSLEVPIQKLTDDGLYWQKPYNLFDLRYANMAKDMYLGLMPRAQFGPHATAKVDLTKIPGRTVSFNPFTSGATQSESVQLSVVSPQRLVTPSNKNWQMVFDNTEFQNILNNIEASLSVLEYRKAEAIQKFKEIQLSNEQDYAHQVSAQFGVPVDDMLSSKSTYLGGIMSNITIDPQVNQNLNDVDSAIIKGTGSSEQEGYINFKNPNNEHGLIIGIYHAVPAVDYAMNTVTKLCMKTDFSQYAIPVFDRLGYEPVNGYSLSPMCFSPSKGFTNIGYAPRYYEYKTAIDEVKGDFNYAIGGTMNHWVAPLVPEQFFDADAYAQNKVMLTWHSFKVNPKMLDSIFVLQANDFINTDNLLIDAKIDVTAVRNLDRAVLPY